MGNERKRSFGNPFGAPAEPTAQVPNDAPDSTPAFSGINVKDLFPPGTERLRHAASLLPDDTEQFHDYAGLLADRIGERRVDPLSFAMAVDLTLYDLQSGLDRFGKPIQHRLAPMHPAVAAMFRIGSTRLAEEAYSPEFGAEVKQILYPPKEA